MNISDVIYEVETGKLFWSVTKGRSKKGEEVGWISKQGYRECSFDGKRRKVHHVIWYFFHNEWPEMLDHINGNKLDNRISNLRKCTSEENARNRKTTTRTLPRNVYHAKTKGKYRVVLNVEGKPKSLGVFDSVEAADSVAKQARELYYGAFAGS